MIVLLVGTAVQHGTVDAFCLILADSGQSRPDSIAVVEHVEDLLGDSNAVVIRDMPPYRDVLPGYDWEMPGLAEESMGKRLVSDAADEFVSVIVELSHAHDEVQPIPRERSRGRFVTSTELLHTFHRLRI